MSPTLAAAQRARALRRRRRAARGGVLAGPADPGAAEARRIARWRSLRPPASTRIAVRVPQPSGRARHPGRVRPAGGGAVGQPLRPRLADHRAARARRPARPHRPDRRRRADAGRASNRPSSPASTQPMLLRPGALPRAEIERVLGSAPTLAAGQRATTGAGRARHARLPLCAARAAAAQRAKRASRRGAARLRSAARPKVPSAPRWCSTCRRAAISIEAAANLFSHLRALDAAGAATIAVMPVPHAGLGEAINDRLARAAAPRA